MRPGRGFTLVELLIVIAIISLLLAILVPSLGYVKELTYIVVCQANLRSLTQGWVAYHQDNRGRLPHPHPPVGGHSWVRKDNTTQALREGVLWDYVASADLYRCLTHRSKFKANPHVRSYSMNMYVGGNGLTWGIAAIGNYAQIRDPGKIMVFMEEDDPRESNMGAWVMDPAIPKWVDFPATWHDGGTTLSFCDGHGEYRKWRDRRTLEITWFWENHPGSVDVAWMLEAYCPPDAVP